MADYGKTEPLLTPLVQKDPHDEEGKWLLRVGDYKMGIAERWLGREALAEDRFHRCLDGRLAFLKINPDVTSQLEVTLAEAQLGQVDEVEQTAPGLRSKVLHHPGLLLHIAEAYALCSAATRREAGDKIAAKTTGSEQEFQTRAVGLLHEAVANGYRDRWSLEHNPDLLELRENQAFRQLLSQIPGS
jgi:hypothetical protein